ncbi:MAG: ferrous iron transport protein B [Prevotella sp.]|uniref:ferrous iron transport protein B n=1 Tax=Prevotella sp. TaxID=59823 RepID=UPI002A32BE39|nr:ferrous iron transport protein B [Prevotella sp.]MDD7318232.1 ferrous iron transport protein B [Prevotellaceae bacterium]MDY4020879.1 ferrous iron transport protein B [Prevotella sp.]
MQLSELKTGERGIIVKVYGHGGFRKRIIEMGFIRGKTVEVLLNAPLQDPVKYKIMGYEISLRHSEAAHIEIVKKTSNTPTTNGNAGNGGSLTLGSEAAGIHSQAMKRHREINVALVGNPNCGKTSLFNFASGAHERVGNYSGVTVDAKEGVAEFKGYKFNIIDLPGTYSLSAYSPEELYVRKQIVEKTPDVVLNVIDTSNLERNLYLTTQLIDMNLCMVGALNMYDEIEKRGDRLDYNKLSELLGFPLVPTVFKNGDGVEELFKTIIQVYEGTYKKTPVRHIHINHGEYIENAIGEIQEHLKAYDEVRRQFSTRYLAIKLLENDKQVEKSISDLPDFDEIIAHRDEAAMRLKEEVHEDSETSVMDAKYGFIYGALKEVGYTEGTNTDNYRITHRLDALITHKWLGFPLFFLFIYLMFFTTFKVGQYPMDWIEIGVAALSSWLNGVMPDGPLRAMVVDGAIAGVGSVIVFLPQILILYMFISFMEDSGYMARAAFIMDKMMHGMGVHGKSFIPLIMGFGCNVPAVMATRTIESRRSRLVTMLVLPLTSCSARLPIYIMIVGAFFAVEYQTYIMILLYATGIILAVIMSRIFSKFIVKGEDTPFVMELPPYRFPTAKAITRHTWEKGKQYLKKMGGIILVASIIVWALGYFPHDDSLDQQQQQEQSYIGRMGKTIEPVFYVQGFDWKLDVSLIAGIGAKEIVASTIGVLYANDGELAEEDLEDSNARYANLHNKMTADGITPLVAFSYLIFVLIYFPCIATIAAIKGETGSWKWALFAACYTTALAWVVSAMVYQVGRVLGF